MDPFNQSSNQEGFERTYFPHVQNWPWHSKLYWNRVKIDMGSVNGCEVVLGQQTYDFICSE